MANSGAATLSTKLINICFKRTGIKIKQGYGMTETCPTVFNQTWDSWDDPVGSTGQLLPNVEAKICKISSATNEKSHRIAHDQPQSLPQGAVGELYVRGPNIFPGYHNNPAATADSLSPSGWYRTGDVGFIDSRNNLFITDRVKELIKYKGFQVAPAELEGYLLEHPLITDCAVVGIQSEELSTELPRAYIVLKENKGNDHLMVAEEVLQWFNSRVSNHKKLRGGVRSVKSIPRSASGKILRKVLKEWISEERSIDNSSTRARL
jgi:acyl-CoA synthetase (AMP-forming)/AMP-acid ligase II